MDLSIGILGSGAAGLITAYTLLNDGFSVQILTRDSSPGGVWAKHRVLDGLTLNNVHGEFRFSSLPMPSPSRIKGGDARLTGMDLNLYMESFAEIFFKNKFRFNVEILNVSRNGDQSTGGWIVSIEDKINKNREELYFDKIVLCTGGCSEPFIPENLLNQSRLFRGPVCHSSNFNAYNSKILAASSPSGDGEGRIVVVGGGKSAQDIASNLTNQGKKVAIVFETTDAVLASPTPLPFFVRKSRFLGLLSPHRELRSRLEKFLHTTRLGGVIVRTVWAVITYIGLRTLSVTSPSPLANAHSLLWSIRINDEGVGYPNRFYAHVKTGAIDLIAQARVVSFGEDGRSVILSDGTSLRADAVVFATGYTSSWKKIFTESTMEDIGLSRHPPTLESIEASKHKWDYTSFKHPPPKSHTDSDLQWCSSIYQGIVPAKSILRRDIAVNGAIFCTNNGYTWEVAAHWISSYFLNDKFLRLPSSIEQTLAITEMNAAWMRKRWPNMLIWANESYSGNVAFFTWPQFCDELLDDMGLKNHRSGGGWLTWPFKTIDLKEIETLAEERRERNARGVTSSQ